MPPIPHRCGKAGRDPASGGRKPCRPPDRGARGLQRNQHCLNLCRARRRSGAWVHSARRGIRAIQGRPRVARRGLWIAVRGGCLQREHRLRSFLSLFGLESGGPSFGHGVAAYLWPAGHPIELFEQPWSAPVSREADAAVVAERTRGQAGGCHVCGDGRNVRDWLHVEDHARALDVVLRRGRPGECDTIGARSEQRNIDTVRLLCDRLDEAAPRLARPRRDLIRFVTDRPGHDRRYTIGPTNIETEPGWRPKQGFERGVASTIDWYIANRDWWTPLRGG